VNTAILIRFRWKVWRNIPLPRRDTSLKYPTNFKKMRNGAKIEGEDGKKYPTPDSVEAWANSA
jgi:hypothetical protein